MKTCKYFLFLLSFLFILSACTTEAAGSFYSTDLPETFNKGVNLTGWFQNSNSSTDIPDLNLYTKKDFENIKEMGCDVIRLPVQFDGLIDENYQIKDIILTYLDKACDWAEDLQLHLVIDNHSFASERGDEYPDAEELRTHLTKIWPQIASRYKNRSRYIIFEILNEPQPKIENSTWNEIQEEVLKIIRKYDKKHTVVVTGGDWGHWDDMLKIPEYEDKNLIYTFHFYEPFYFTHQGASWTSNMSDLSGIPFPYDESRIPEIPESLKGTEDGKNIENYLKGDGKGSYRYDSDPEIIKNKLEEITEFSKERNVPVWCGEMGAYSKSAGYEDRIAWFKTIGSFFQELNLPFCVWGYNDSFGFFEKDSLKEYPWDLNTEIVEALGMNVPVNYGERPEGKNNLEFPFVFYEDFPSEKVLFSVYKRNENADISLCTKTSSAEGEYCICFGEADQYSNISFSPKNTDFTSLKAKSEGVLLHFYIKFTDSRQQLQFRFNDKDDIDNGIIPWRLGIDIKASSYEINKWNLVEIPLDNMTVLGAWSNKIQKWYKAASDSEFDWENLEKLSLTAEADSVSGDIFIDDIKLVEVEKN